MNKSEIEKIIPHRDPMLLLDSVISMEPGKRITAMFYVSPEREIFKGHFPNEPVLPGVYTVEIMAQAADVLLLSCDRYKEKTPLFLGINNVRFMRKIKPGAELEIDVEIVSEKEEKAIATCYAKVYENEELACCGEVTLAMR